MVLATPEIRRVVHGWDQPKLRGNQRIPRCHQHLLVGRHVDLRDSGDILHSRQDDVVSFADSEELRANSNLPSEVLIEVGTDHRLADAEPLEAMLDQCERIQLKS